MPAAQISAKFAHLTGTAADNENSDLPADPTDCERAAAERCLWDQPRGQHPGAAVASMEPDVYYGRTSWAIGPFLLSVWDSPSVLFVEASAMRFRAAILVLAVSSTAIGFGFWRAASAAAANDELVTVAAVVALSALTDEEPSYAYVGNKKCKKCHIKQHKSWEKTRMGKAFEILRPGNNKEAKEKFNLDVGKDYTTDEKCLKCHTVGYGKPGGYAIPDPEDKKAVRKAQKLEGIGCECCHGPGSEYIKVFDEIRKSKRKYKVEELYAVGLRKIDGSVCETCHNEESPSVNPGDLFDYEKRKDDGTHEHYPLKQREE